MILVTGATGKVGKHVAAQLVAEGVAVRALVRDPATAVLPDGVEAVRGDLADPASLTAALAEEEVEGVFLIWPLAGPRGGAEAVAALAEHTRRIVYLSARGVPDDETAQLTEDIFGTHAALERLIRASVAEWTLLRPGGFAGNTLLWAPQIRAGGPVRTAHPQAARTLVHEADIATAAVRALLTGDLVGRRPNSPAPNCSPRPSRSPSSARSSAATSPSRSSPAARPATICWRRACLPPTRTASSTRTPRWRPTRRPSHPEPWSCWAVGPSPTGSG